LLQRLLSVLGEPSFDECYVFYVVNDENDHVTFGDYEYATDALDFAKVQRARRLFPEAVIVAGWIRMEELAPEEAEQLERLLLK